MMGVDYDLFWTLNPKSLIPFVKAFNLKQEYDDAMAWKSGTYVRMAIASCLDKNIKYPKKPLMSDYKNDKPMSSDEIKKRVMAHAELINTKFGKE